MPKTIVLDRLKIQTIQIHRRVVEVASGSVDDRGNVIIENIEQWALTINYSMFGLQPEGEAKQNGVKTFLYNGQDEKDKKAQQQKDIPKFLKPYLKELKAEIDIQDGEEWVEEEDILHPPE